MLSKLIPPLEVFANNTLLIPPTSLLQVIYAVFPADAIWESCWSPSPLSSGIGLLNVACCACAIGNSREVGNKCTDSTIVKLTKIDNKIIGIRVLILGPSLGLNLGARITLDNMYIGLIEFHKKVIDKNILRNLVVIKLNFYYSKIKEIFV